MYQSVLMFWFSVKITHIFKVFLFISVIKVWYCVLFFGHRWLPQWQKMGRSRMCQQPEWSDFWGTGRTVTIPLPFALARGLADVALTASPRLSALFNTVITPCFYVYFYCSKRLWCRSVAKFLEVSVAGMCISLLLSWFYCVFFRNFHGLCHALGTACRMIWANGALSMASSPVLCPAEMPLYGRILLKGWRAASLSRTYLFNTVITHCFYVCFYCSKGPWCRKVVKFLEVLVSDWFISLLVFWFYCVFEKFSWSVPCHGQTAPSP